MASWILVPCLVSLRTEFNTLAPDRDKSSDGSVGDTSHAANSSDHNPDETGNTPTDDADKINEVHAIDVDVDLRKPGWTMTRATEIIRLRHQTGADNRLQNIIYNRRIASRSWGWTWRAYSGPNPHDHHGHFGARYTTAQEADTSPWGLLADDKPPRKVTMEKFTSQLPVLKFGDDDRKKITPEGTFWVTRVQRQLQIVDDGIYGPETVSAVKDLMASGDEKPAWTGNGRTIDLPVWIRLYALWGAKELKV